jgi:hypothetical protein
MQRNFDLEEIGLKEFAKLSSKEGLPENSILMGQKAMHTRMLNLIEYEDLSYLVFSLLQDEQLRPTMIWDPKGNLSTYNAEKEFKKDPQDYLSTMSRNRPSPRRILTRLSNGNKKGDSFMFDQERGVWLLRYFKIAKQNFNSYKFDGINSDENTFVLGIYSRD